ncbi:cytochrome c biogenesis CcdA family protein [Schnuerera sp. xch1]|uniref:cytochrome c biogenesis CcdA family protein n=1 Tax=Schnuerera sp. xch1 TaxID=2874283 RepID=UPI001CC0D008|nr:cytochrome c biogenesis CcdA family protein [Schnuerera sp. xch1]MBZ2174763.1 cytochrome c biogenesis CcdA family protein [Schnuerera sp. xch1]
MILNDVSTPIAFGAGFLSFFSPCVLPMIPVYIMYMTGASMESELRKRKITALIRTIGFIIGFTIIFMVMGTSASFLGKIFIRNREIFLRISGILIIIFGLSMMGIFNFKFLSMERKVSIPRQTKNWFSSILMGMAFAAGWTPCFGPVLASILIMAGGTATVSQGVFLLLVYSIGMAIPFILTALFINIFSKFLERTQKVMIYLPKVGGIIMIIFGLLVFFNKVVDISRLL